MNNNPDKRMTAKEVAVVTGAGRGIGRAIAVKLAEKGCNVVINYSVSGNGAAETANICRKKGAKAIIVQGNVTSFEDCIKIVESAKDIFGRVDILVNNAGITRDNILVRMTEREFRDVLDINLIGSFNMMKAAAALMIRQRYGRIINIASVSGIMGNHGQANYSASKAGIIGMTKSYAKEVSGRNITVNAVAPGMIKTDMTNKMKEKLLASMLEQIPAGRLGEPEDVAEATAFLADRSSGYITGQTICVDGGMCM